MINFNKSNVNILSFFISSIIFLIIISIINYPKSSNISNSSINIINCLEDEEMKEIEKWTIEIKSLGIKANINEIDGDTPTDDYVGHFKDTSILGDNIALIAFNYGKDKNYFANLKDLKIGDEIIYTVNDKVKKYKVSFNQIIEKQNLKSIIENNNTSSLKLFTYVKNLSNNLRYVYAQETIDI